MTEQSTTREQMNAFFGILFLSLGAVLAALIFVDRWTSIGLAFPGFWYTSRSFHVPVSAALFLAGWQAHRKARTLNQDLSHLPVFESVRVYSKPDCELCDRAVQVLHKYADQLPPVEVIDISGNAPLESAHAKSIPVVEIDGRVRFRGHVNSELLQRLIRARRRQRHSTDLPLNNPDVGKPTSDRS